MKEIFRDRAEDAWKLGSFAFACLVIVIWIGARACFAFLQEAIFYSLQEWLLLRNQRRRPRQPRFNSGLLLSDRTAEFLKFGSAFPVLRGMKMSNYKREN